MAFELHGPRPLGSDGTAMKTRFLLLLGAAAAATSGNAPPGRADAPTASPQTTTETAVPSAADIAAFAQIYAALAAARARFERELGNARTAADVQSLRCRLRAAQRAALARHGWTAQRFSRMAATLDANPAVVERAIAVLASGT